MICDSGGASPLADGRQLLFPERRIPTKSAINKTTPLDELLCLSLEVLPEVDVSS
jgi:hypothetical protein